MELGHIAVRAVFVYLVLLGLIRASGKRAVAQATPFDFVLALILGDLIDDGLWAEVPAAQFVVAASTLAIVHLLVAWATGRNPRLERMVDGQPTPLVLQGRLLRRGLRGERMNEKDVACEVRHHGLLEEQWPQVEAAHLEDSGTVSLLRADWARPVQRRDAAAVKRAARALRGPR